MLVRLCLILTAVLSLLSVGSFVGVLLHDGILQILPSYTVYMCFMNGMCSGDREPDVTQLTIEKHVNSTLLWLISINFISNIIMAYCIYKLRGIKNEFNIRLEMIFTFGVWLLTTQLTLGLFIHQSPSFPTFDWVYLLLIVRSVLAGVLTAGRPLQMTLGRAALKPDRQLLLPPSHESIETLDMVLQIPIALEYFFNYLEEVDESRGDSTHIFALYVDLRHFEKAVAGCDDDAILEKA